MYSIIMFNVFPYYNKTTRRSLFERNLVTNIIVCTIQKQTVFNRHRLDERLGSIKKKKTYLKDVIKK